MHHFLDVDRAGTRTDYPDQPLPPWYGALFDGQGQWLNKVGWLEPTVRHKPLEVRRSIIPVGNQAGSSARGVYGNDQRSGSAERL